MSMKKDKGEDTKEVSVIRLTKLKQWYMPVDAESYLILKAAGLPLLRIHEDMLETVGLLLKRNNIRAKSIKFNEELLEPYLDKIAATWQKGEHFTARITSNVMVFKTEHASVLEKGRERAVKLEDALRRFFERWGYIATIEKSEKRNKLLIHVTYKYSSDRNPVLHLEQEAEAMPTFSVELGFVKLTISMGAKELEVNVSAKAGTGWNSLHTSRTIYSQISNVKPMIACLMDIVNRDPDNFENKPYGKNQS